MPRHQHKTIRAREEALDDKLGKTFCSGWGPAPPDLTAANEAARSQAEIARQQWADYRDNFAPVILDQLQQQIQIGKDQHGLAREQQDFQLGLARKYDDRYWGTQVPLEDQIVGEARTFDTEAERERMAGEARGDVEQAFGSAQETMRRDMGRSGVNPADPKFFSMQKEFAAQKALASSTAMNKVRAAAKQMGWAKRVDAAALGRGLPGFSSGSNQMAMGWGGQGMQGAGMGMDAATTALNGMNQTATSAGNNYGSAGANMRANAVAGNENPGFDSMMGVAAGGLFAYGASRKPAAPETYANRVGML